MIAFIFIGGTLVALAALVVGWQRHARAEKRRAEFRENAERRARRRLYYL